MTQQVPKERKISRKLTIALPIVLAITLFLWLVPTTFFGIEGLTVTEQRTIAIFVFAALMWMFEIIPTWTTSVLIIVIMLLTISDSSLSFMKGSGIPAETGTFVSYKSLMATFADPVIMLFLGGFILAIAATKVGMDVQLARVLLKPFGKKSEIGFVVGVKDKTDFKGELKSILKVLDKPLNNEMLSLMNFMRGKFYLRYNSSPLYPTEITLLAL